MIYEHTKEDYQAIGLFEVKDEFPEFYAKLEAVPCWSELLGYALGKRAYKKANSACEKSAIEQVELEFTNAGVDQ